MSDILTDISNFIAFFFSVGDTSGNRSLYLQRIVEFVVSDPLVLAVIAMFFVGFVVSIFIRLFHSA